MNHPSSSTEAAATARAQHPLAERRERRGFSVTRLAGEIGASPATVRRWETGDAVPDRRRVADLADALALPTGVVAAWWTP